MSNRLGHQVITTILSDDLSNSGQKHAKGMFTGNRNHKIACRLYYHFSIKGLQYTRAVAELHNEFDLSETRLAQILMMDTTTEVLKELKAKNADRKFLQRKYPYFTWY